MEPTDPRERYEDLYIDGDTEHVDAETFRDRRRMETFQSGWVVVGTVFDPSDRVLLVSDGDQWFAPGGTRRPGETLAETLVREVEEEAGVPVDPVRPHAVFDQRVVGPDGDEIGFTLVGYEARTDATTTGSEVDVVDGEIETAAFHETIPDPVFGASLLGELLDRGTPSAWSAAAVE
ncbi:MAG: NUDIX hydrolase [Halobacteriaceae archaeon]